MPGSVGDAQGVFGPGHLGELTRHLLVDLVDAVVEETRTVQRRMRCLPSRVGVYFVLALALFPSLGYLRVWDKLTTGLKARPHPRPSEKALRDLRRRLGPAPLKAVFEVVAGPLAQPRTPGVCYRRWRTVAFDGCSSVKVPDHERNRAWLGRIATASGWAGYPMLRLMALCETGTRGLLGAVFGPIGEYETTYAQRLLPLLTPRMLLLADRGFDSNAFLQQIADTRAQFLIRLNHRRRPGVLAVLPDGSYLTRLGNLRVRVLDAQVTVTTSGGNRLSEHYRLATTLLDHRRDPASALVRLYHERWEVESAFYALRHTLLDGLVLRSQDPTGLAQELWAQLTVYQLLRMAMVEAAESRPGTDPDRAGFTIALETARDHVILATGRDDTTSIAVGAIGRAVLAGLLPPRRKRISRRRVKAPISRYHSRPADPRPTHSQRITHLNIDIHQATATPPPPVVDTPHDVRRASLGPGVSGAGHRNRTLQLMAADPDRAWHPRELAKALGIHNTKSFGTQMLTWLADGFLRKIRRGTYVLTDAWTPRTEGLTAPTIP
nr:IS4 family transposase [Saccharothrix sp. NRRL B-16348]